MHPLRQRMLEDMRIRNFAPSTQRSYIQAMARFAQHFGRSPDQLGPEEIRGYQIYLIEEKHLGFGALSTVVSALRFGRLQFFGELKPLQDPGSWRRYVQEQRRRKWVVYSKRPFGGPETVSDHGAEPLLK